jgi:hypothetical protein
MKVEYTSDKGLVTYAEGEGFYVDNERIIAGSFLPLVGGVMGPGATIEWNGEGDWLRLRGAVAAGSAAGRSCPQADMAPCCVGKSVLAHTMTLKYPYEDIHVS